MSTDVMSPGDAACAPGVEELVVLVDDDGRAIGTAPKATVHNARTPLHRAFSCYLFGPDDQVLLTRRAVHKATFPGLWTNSVCGHPAPGESDPDAITRRCADELGLVAGSLRGMAPALPTFRYTAEHLGVVENEICPVYLARLEPDAAPAPDPDEVDDLRWMPWADFMAAWTAQPHEFSPWCREQAVLLDGQGLVADFLAST
jgi:isopentenyl-diphosphate delta-isomerase